MSRALLALVLLAFPAFSAGKDPWVKITSPNFELVTDGSERAGRDVVKHFEQVHSFFVQRFKLAIESGRHARVILFRNEREYQPYAPSQSAAAFFHPGEFHDYIVMHNSAADWRSMAVHELTHLMVHQLTQELPLWLNEGLAELYSNMEPRGAQMMVGRDIPGRMQTLANGRWIDLRELLAVDQTSPLYTEKSRSAIFYAESWKLVHMLHLHPGYEAHLGDLLRGLAKGDPEAAFRSAYGKDLETVQHDLREYLTGHTISALLFDIQLPKSIDAPEIEQGAALTARLSIAELLAGTRGRSEDAAAAYSAIATDYPNRWEVEQAQGLFAWHERRIDDATAHFAKAEQLGCRDGGMFLLWGRVLGYTNRTRDAVTVLARASTLIPDSSDVQAEYGNALVRNGNWGAAVAALHRVKTVPPAGAWRYWYNVAYSLYKLGDTAEAKQALASARKFAFSSRENTSLDQLEAALSHR